MSTWVLFILVALAWLSYPVAGGTGVAADVAEGKRPRGAHFSFLPELIVFPAAFLGVALLIDLFLMPWGRRTVAGLCVLMFGSHLYTFARSLGRLRNADKLIRQRESEMKSDDSQPAERCHQTILAVLVVATLAGLLLVWAAMEIRNVELRRQAHEKLTWDSKTYSERPFPWYSSWLHKLAGNDESYDLTFLVLNNFAYVDDDTLASIAHFEDLEQLWLNGEIAISDKGLEHLGRLKRLEDLSLGDAAVSANAVKSLQQALPQCKIDWAPPDAGGK
ncbi:MAG: hypothetical protein U1E05_11960 [Patescibacteria group bacterium]|nr:hypothetical protein [Patescibacteria group bacterium]